jgi:hypothetical protein
MLLLDEATLMVLHILFSIRRLQFKCVKGVCVYSVDNYPASVIPPRVSSSRCNDLVCLGGAYDSMTFAPHHLLC